jgi:hypothetical protein
VTESTATDWRQLREFAGVDLNKSFILSWHAEFELLMVDVDLFLTEEHPFYEKPRPAEKFCIRPAIIEFSLCEEISVDGNSNGSIGEIAAALGHGAINGLRRLDDGRCEINGSFGTVIITAERPLLRLKGP